MRNSWRDLMNLLGGQSFSVERVRLAKTGIAIEGDFAPPPLACLSPDDQAFVATFVASHGSIKKMESLFGISYPTVKNRLNAIAAGLDVPRVDIISDPNSESRTKILDQLDRGEITFDEAMEALK